MSNVESVSLEPYSRGGVKGVGGGCSGGIFASPPPPPNFCHKIQTAIDFSQNFLNLIFMDN